MCLIQGEAPRVCQAHGSVYGCMLILSSKVSQAHGFVIRPTQRQFCVMVRVTSYCLDNWRLSRQREIKFLSTVLLLNTSNC